MKRRRTLKRFFLRILVAVVIGLLLAGAWIWVGVGRPYKGYAADEQFVEIPQGAGMYAIGRDLVDAGVARDVATFRSAVTLSGRGRHLQAGEYRFDRAMSAREVVEKIARGEVYLRPLTFPEGLSIKQMAELYESKGFGPASTFKSAAANRELVGSVDPGARDLEGYLFPDTYNLSRRMTADQLVEKMVAGFDHALTPELRQQGDARGLSVRQLVTLASIVEKETGRPEERPVVAAVYANRLRIGMGLQCDPTVIYALAMRNAFDGNIRKEDLKIDSRYNTYRYSGLPPGPIGNPGAAALQAAVAPADTSFLYFVSMNTGRHFFSKTLSEHNRAVWEYQVRPFKLRKASRSVSGVRGN